MKEKIGFKVPEINLEGEYTIQLFNENGELVKEEKKHNCINKALFSTAYYNNIFCGLIDNDSRKTDCYGNQNKDDNVGHVNWLMLTNDSDAVENDSKNPVIMGEMVGYAHSSSTNSYSDLKRGLINSNETTKVNNYVDGSDKKIKSVTKHYVWDFATDKGNGVFDNLYLTGVPVNVYSVNPNNYRGDLCKNSNLILNSKNTEGIDTTDSGPFSHDDENLYIQCLFLANKISNVHYRCYDTIAKINQNTWAIEYITLQVPGANSDNAAYVIQAGGYFWRIEYNFECTKYRLNGEYVGFVNLSSQFSNSFFNLGNSIKNLSYDGSTTYAKKWNFDVFTGDEKYLYVGYMTSDLKRYICVFDSDNRKVSEIYLGDRNDNSNYHQSVLNILYVNNKKLLLSCPCNGDTKVYNIDDNGVFIEKSGDNLKYLSEMIKSYSDGNGSYNCVFYNKKGELFFIPYKKQTVYSSEIIVGHFIPWTSHVKLDSPITKTSANTMKIQYDITCEYVPVGGIENIE